MKKITLTNDFHNIEVTLRIEELEGAAIGKLSANQVKKARRELCGMSDCTCSGDTGCRGNQQYEVEPIFDDRTNAITGALVYER